MQHVTRHLDPIVEKYCLHLRDDGSLNLKVAVPPMVGVLCLPGPLRCDSDPAGKCDPDIHDQDFSMRSIVQTFQMRPVWRMKFLYLDAHCRHVVNELVVYFRTPDPNQ